MGIFICPCCGKDLEWSGSVCRCEAGHSYDIAKAGYVNLLPVNRKGAKSPGDSKEMCRARSQFFAGDFYRPLRVQLDALLCRLTAGLHQPVILDVGCGEGYYTNSIAHALKQQGREATVIGSDISKFALQHAAKGKEGCTYVVASLFSLPVKNESVDILVDIFAPVCMEEFFRVLKPGGMAVLVVPGPKHLWEFKCAAYEQPYENPVKSFAFPGWHEQQQIEVLDCAHLASQQDIASLMQMTPYFYKTPQAGRAHLACMQQLDTQIHFLVHVLQKTEYYTACFAPQKGIPKG